MIGWLVLVYALLVVAGGVMGFKAGSTVSLVAATIAGLALAGGSALMMRGQYQNGWWLSLIVMLLLLGRFGMAALRQGSFKMMPTGMVIIISLIVLVALLLQRTPAAR